MKSRPPTDLTIYVKAFGLLARHPSIFVMPLLAAVVELLLTQLSYLFTDPLGGSGAGLFQMLVQLFYLWAFGITIIQANAVWRGRRGAFDEAWDEGRAKFVGILFAAIGFQFSGSCSGSWQRCSSSTRSRRLRSAEYRARLRSHNPYEPFVLRRLRLSYSLSSSSCSGTSPCHWDYHTS
jgi:hypothetical protein